jgi:hypothetical protein
MPSSRLAVVLPLVLLGACGGGSGLAGTSGGSGGPAPSLRTEIGSSLAEGVSLALGLITLDHPGLPFGFNSVAGCPVPSNTDDADHDDILDDANLTFTDPPCHSNVASGGSVGVTGILGLHDGGVITPTDYNLNFTQLTWTFLDGASNMTETAVRNGLATRLGDADSALIQFNDFTDRARPGKAVAHIQLAGSVLFTPDQGNFINVLGPLPKGSLTIVGALDWRRSTEDFELTITTPVALQFDPGCSSFQPISVGEVDLQGTVANTTGIFHVVFAGCGNNPTVTFTE